MSTNAIVLDPKKVDKTSPKIDVPNEKSPKEAPEKKAHGMKDLLRNSLTPLRARSSSIGPTSGFFNKKNSIQLKLQNQQMQVPKILLMTISTFRKKTNKTKTIQKETRTLFRQQEIEKNRFPLIFLIPICKN